MSLKDLRLNAGLTQEYVGLKLNVTQGAVSRWESGKTMPARKYIKPLAKLYRCTPDSIRDMLNAVKDSSSDSYAER